MKTKKRHFIGLTILLATAIISYSYWVHADSSRFKHLEIFSRVLHLIESQYYRPVDTNKLVKGAIRGMMNTLDPHSSFLSEKVFSKLQEDTHGEFGGLGIEVTLKEGVIIISTPIDGSPAFKAGLLSGDKILEIDHESIVGISLEEAVNKMRGKVNTKVTLGIQRRGIVGLRHYTIKRKIIEIKPVKSALLENRFLYIRLSQFQKKSYAYIVKSIKKHKKAAAKKGGLKGMVLDLRFNPGGLLEQAVDISSIFLRDGVVVYTEGRNPKGREYYYVKKMVHKELGLPLVVLINGASASASEIVAGALQDSKRATIMGSVSFGKGSVQSVAKIDDKTGVKMTIRQYMTPSGKKIQAIGIRPNIPIPEYHSQPVGEDSYIRERDLRGHLTATIETPNEKKTRLKREKKRRKRRALAIKKQHKKKNIIPMLPNRPNYKPKKDYQVLQAIKHLKKHHSSNKVKRAKSHG